MGQTLNEQFACCWYSWESHAWCSYLDIVAKKSVTSLECSEPPSSHPNETCWACGFGVTKKGSKWREIFHAIFHKHILPLKTLFFFTLVDIPSFMSMTCGQNLHGVSLKLHTNIHWNFEFLSKNSSSALFHFYYLFFTTKWDKWENNSKCDVGLHIFMRDIITSWL